MVTKETIAKRLERFEALSGLEYSEEAVEIWWEHFKDKEEGWFRRYCFEIEKKTKWHILTTLNDFYREVEDKWQKP